MISPILEKIANDPHVKTATGSSVDLVTVDADEESSLCGEYDVRPYLYLWQLLPDVFHRCGHSPPL